MRGITQKCLSMPTKGNYIVKLGELDRWAEEQIPAAKREGRAPARPTWNKVSLPLACEGCAGARPSRPYEAIPIVLNGFYEFLKVNNTIPIIFRYVTRQTC